MRFGSHASIFNRYKLDSQTQHCPLSTNFAIFFAIVGANKFILFSLFARTHIVCFRSFLFLLFLSLLHPSLFFGLLFFQKFSARELQIGDSLFLFHSHLQKNGEMPAFTKRTFHLKKCTCLHRFTQQEGWHQEIPRSKALANSVGWTQLLNTGSSAVSEAGGGVCAEPAQWATMNLFTYSAVSHPPPLTVLSGAEIHIPTVMAGSLKIRVTNSLQNFFSRNPLRRNTKFATFVPQLSASTKSWTAVRTNIFPGTSALLLAQYPTFLHVFRADWKETIHFVVSCSPGRQKNILARKIQICHILKEGGGGGDWGEFRPHFFQKAWLQHTHIHTHTHTHTHRICVGRVWTSSVKAYCGKSGHHRKH